MKKRILALILSLTMIFTMSAVNLSAMAKSAEPTITLDSVVAENGQDVSVKVAIENNPGIWGMDLKISYDKTAMTLTSVDNGDFYQDTEWTKGNLSADVYILSYEASGLYNITTTSGILATLNFKVSDTAIPGDYAVTASYKVGDIINVGLDDINFNITNGKVVIEDNVDTPKITLSSSSKSIAVGDSSTITATTTPSGQTVTWTSSNASVATVSGGTITAKALGSTTITAKFTYNGITYSNTCIVTVVPNVPSCLSYTITAGEVTIIDCDIYVSGSLTIPDTIEGYPVKYIGAYAFYYCTSLKSITIPDSVTSIGAYAFEYCNALQTVWYGGNETMCKAMTIGYGNRYLENATWYYTLCIGNGAHTTGELVVDEQPTCADMGIGHKNCITCGQIAQSNIVIPANGAHSWNKGVVTKQPTASNGGIKTYTCTVCAGTKTEFIPATGSDTDADVSKKFTDVKKKDWYYGAVEYAVNNNLFAGTSETTFSPHQNMTRGMFVTVLGRLHGVPAKGQYTKFADVKRSDYFSGYVKWASDNGIVNGTGATAFSPNANITREQICAMMVRYCDYADITLQKVNAAITFKDGNKVSGYAKAAVKACQQGGLVNGEKVSDGYNFRPQGNATRAEVATIMMNFSKTYK